MGSKRNKIKKIISPVNSAPPPPTAPLEDDDDLMDDLMAQLDSRDAEVQRESAPAPNGKQPDTQGSESKHDSKSRFKARQARKAAALAATFSPDNPDQDARLEKETKEEAQNIAKVCDDLGVRVHEIEPDGHCLYSAVADQLSQLGIIPAAQATYTQMRLAACNYIYSHRDDFLPFLPSAEGEDGPGATSAGMMSPEEFNRYCAAIRDTAVWGGEPEILALSRTFRVPIHVVQNGSPPVVIHTPDGSQGDPKDPNVVRISYHRRMYGLGEHYNSLRSGKHHITSAVSSFLKDL